MIYLKFKDNSKNFQGTIMFVKKIDDETSMIEVWDASKRDYAFMSPVLTQDELQSLIDFYKKESDIEMVSYYTKVKNKNQIFKIVSNDDIKNNMIYDLEYLNKSNVSKDYIDSFNTIIA